MTKERITSQKQVTLYLNENTIKELDEIAEKAGIKSRTQLIRMILEGEINRIKKEGFKLKLF